MEFIVSILLGIGLSASCGFRVFVPLLVTNVASLIDYIKFSPGFEWIGGWVSFAVFATATIVEIGAYYIPWLDNLLDTISTPLSVIAGTVLTASFITEMNPLAQWTLGIIVGGGTAGIIAAGTSAVRLGSSATTGGLGNHIISTIENAVSFIFSILSILIPVVMGITALIALGYFGGKLLNRKGKKQSITAEKINNIE
ncbi:MAG: DUF4126 domain-containing protein [Ignavibacteria bacterium]